MLFRSGYITVIQEPYARNTYHPSYMYPYLNQPTAAPQTPRRTTRTQDQDTPTSSNSGGIRFVQARDIPFGREARGNVLSSLEHAASQSASQSLAPRAENRTDASRSAYTGPHDHRQQARPGGTARGNTPGFIIQQGSQPEDPFSNPARDTVDSPGTAFLKTYENRRPSRQVPTARSNIPSVQEPQAGREVIEAQGRQDSPRNRPWTADNARESPRGDEQIYSFADALNITPTQSTFPSGPQRAEASSSHGLRGLLQRRGRAQLYGRHQNIPAIRIVDADAPSPPSALKITTAKCGPKIGRAHV